jgi:hypothetical protein
MNKEELIEKWTDRHYQVLEEYSKGSSDNNEMKLMRSRMKDMQDFISDIKQLKTEPEEETSDFTAHFNL